MHATIYIQLFQVTTPQRATAVRQYSILVNFHVDIAYTARVAHLVCQLDSAGRVDIGPLRGARYVIGHVLLILSDNRKSSS